MSIYDFKMESLSGDTIDFSEFEGKKLLIVNVASKCGFTPQYEGLQELHEKYSDQVTVLGVPCNQFGGQEPGTHSEIADFCKKNYGVTFQITEKVDVKGKDQHPLYSWLTEKEKNGVKDSAVKWNFHKYLIDEKGNLIEEFGSRTEPMSEELILLITK
jgi:glutathione peroxidase